MFYFLCLRSVGGVPRPSHIVADRGRGDTAAFDATPIVVYGVLGEGFTQLSKRHAPLAHHSA